ncbi:hypothetical protein [Bacillus thuringiensis]
MSRGRWLQGPHVGMTSYASTPFITESQTALSYQVATSPGLYRPI